MSVKENIIFIAGPTASGKSGLAVKLAHNLNGEIVNADALQVYKDLSILSARPTLEEQGATPHHLYGYLDGAQPCSAGIWSRKAGQVIEDILARKKTAIVVGGTGLYFRALIDGLSPIPEVSQHARDAAAARLEEIGQDKFYQEVTTIDPPMARLAPADRQRLLRAWEVHNETGLALSHYQNMPRQPVLHHTIATKIVLLPMREKLYTQCNNRFLAMLEAGGLEEARTLLNRQLPDTLPVLKALGVAELIAHLQGTLTLPEAITLAQRNTRRFAKRQMTWFRGQASDWTTAISTEEALKLIGKTDAQLSHNT